MVGGRDTIACIVIMVWVVIVFFNLLFVAISWSTIQAMRTAVDDIGQRMVQTADTLREQNAQRATTFLIVTHNPDLARRCDRVVELIDGAVVYEGPPSGMSAAKAP